MPVEIKIISLQKLGHIVVGLWVDQDRSQHCLFSFPIMRDNLGPTGRFGFKRRKFAHRSI
jgi:hypothetical protein